MNSAPCFTWVHRPLVQLPSVHRDDRPDGRFPFQSGSREPSRLFPLSHRYSYLAHEYSYLATVLAIPTSVLAVVRAVSVVFLLLFLGRYSKRPNIPNIIFASRCDTAHYKSLFFYRPTIIPNMIPTMKGNIF